MQAELRKAGQAVEHLTPGHQIRFNFPATVVGVRRALSNVMSDLAALHLDASEAGCVELVLAEALNNVVEHAYAGVENGAVELICRAQSDGLRVDIRDRGRAMPDGAVPLASLATMVPPLPDLPEGGFGWLIIRDLARDITYRRERDTNHLSFRIVIGTTLRVI